MKLDINGRHRADLDDAYMSLAAAILMGACYAASPHTRFVLMHDRAHSTELGKILLASAGIMPAAALVHWLVGRFSLKKD